MDIIELDAVDTKKKLLGKEINSKEIVQSYLARIHDRKEINAYVSVFDEAIQKSETIYKRTLMVQLVRVISLSLIL